MPTLHFSGALDEVAIYARVLSNSEVLSHYYLARGYCGMYDSPIKIMPLGDSITYDNHTGDSRPSGQRTAYRWPLWLWLNNGGYWVDFVGSEVAGQSMFPWFDPDNAGFPGVTDDQLAVLLDTGINQYPEPDEQVTPGPYLQYYPADVILLHAGTNELDTDIAAMVSVLDEIDEQNENTTVILARILDRIPLLPNSTTHQFNDNIEAMAMSRITNGDKIIMVDMEDIPGFVYQIDTEPPNDLGDMYDNLHPNNVVNPEVIDSGYGKMADQWFATLETFLPKSLVPDIISFPATIVNEGELYSYTIETDGKPEPTLSIIEPDPAPGNFLFEPGNRLLTWTPDPGAADVNISIEATNWLGSDLQEFTLLVNNAPIVSDIPDQVIEEAMQFSPIGLDAYVSDSDNPDGEMIWTYSGNVELSVTIVDRVATVTTPGEDWNGSETITFTATDPGGLSAEETVAFGIDGINDAPLITGYAPLSVMENTTFTIELSILTVNDPDNTYPDDFTLTIYGGSNYTFSGNSVTPAKSYVGELYIPVSVNDGNDDSNIFNVVVTVNGADDGDSGSDESLCFIGSIRN